MKPLQPPDSSMKVWRCIDAPKLIDFLEAGSLHFSRADTLGDPYEGSWTQLDVPAYEEQFQSIAAELGTSKEPDAGKDPRSFQGDDATPPRDHVHQLLKRCRNRDHSDVAAV